MSRSRYLITSALPYANGPIHIGHLAGAYLSADIYVRFRRLLGDDVVYIGGSDEHGAAITIRAAKEGVTPQEIVDKYHAQFQDTFSRIGISFDMYHRTSEAIHHDTSQEFFRNLFEKGEFDVRETEQYYDQKAKQFLADRYIMGTCPKCNHTDAYGDQCEKCGSTLSPTDLIEPKSTLSGDSPVLKKTSHFYLPLDKYEEWLKEWIETGHKEGKQLHFPDEWKNHVLGQCRSWLDGGLQPRAMTRDLTWGVDVPQDIPGSEGKKLYVWMDAPIGYISATKQWAEDNGKNWKDYWQNEDTHLIHFIGKDNIVFHCIIFPAILNAHGGYNLPENVPANQFMNLEGKKISTSRNWAVWVHEYLDEMPGMEDELRYALIKNMPEQKDSEFTWAGYQEAVNNELVNNLANFINRVVVLTHKYYDGVVPDFDGEEMIKGAHPEDDMSFHDSEMLRLFDKLQEVAESIRRYDFRGGLQQVMEISSLGNQLLQFNEPWKLQKTDPERVKIIMNLGVQYVGALSVIVRPFLPFLSDKLRTLMALESIEESGELNAMLDILAEGEVIVPPGHKIGEPIHVFSRVDDALIAKQMDKLEASKAEKQSPESSYPPVKEEVTYDEFMKMDIRTATILEAEKVKKADKLLKLTLDLGFEQRTVVSGIAEHYAPEEVIGQQVSYLANLAPRKIRGVESAGMVLMAEDSEGKLVFVKPSIEKWPDGSTVR